MRKFLDLALQTSCLCKCGSPSLQLPRLWTLHCHWMLGWDWLNFHNRLVCPWSLVHTCICWATVTHTSLEFWSHAYNHVVAMDLQTNCLIHCLHNIMYILGSYYFAITRASRRNQWFLQDFFFFCISWMEKSFLLVGYPNFLPSPWNVLVCKNIHFTHILTI